MISVRSFGAVKHNAHALWKKFLSLFQKEQFCYGSRRVQLDLKPVNDKSLFYAKQKGGPGNIYYKIAEQYDLKNKLKLGEELFGEIVGCFDSLTPIKMSDGKNITMTNLFTRFIAGEELYVLTYNIKDGGLEPKKVLNVIRRPSQDSEWISLRYRRRRRGGKDCWLVCTKNHKIFDSDFREISASKLQVGSTVYLNAPKTLTFIQEQVVLGTLIGDGSLSGYSLQYGHSYKYKEYTQHKKDLLSSVVSRESKAISGKGSEMTVVSTQSLHDKFSCDLRDICFRDGKKQITQEWLDKMTPLAWAIWYMDDGSVSYDTDVRRGRCHLHTQGFDETSINLVLQYFNKKGIECYKSKSPREGHFFITFSPEGALAFQLLISPYIIDSMRYKLLESLQKHAPVNLPVISQLEDTETGVISTVIEEIRQGKVRAKSNRFKYDLEVEDNHNYFANNVLVHNSGVQKNYTYGCKDGEHKFFAYDVAVNGRFLNFAELVEWCQERGIPKVPTVYLGEYDKEKLEKVTSGDSLIGGQKVREGIVIKPQIDRNHPNVGRLIFKQINPDYYLAKDNTDFH